MSLTPVKSNVDQWKKYFNVGGFSSLTTKPVATVARAAATLKRQNGIKGGGSKKSTSRNRSSKPNTSKKRKPVKKTAGLKQRNRKKPGSKTGSKKKTGPKHKKSKIPKKQGSKRGRSVSKKSAWPRKICCQI